MRGTLNQFLSQESLEEQRINFLASQARIQTSQAAVNYEQDRKEIAAEEKMQELLHVQEAETTITNYFSLCESNVNRFKAVREEDQKIQKKLDHEQAVAESEQQMRVFEAVASVLEQFPLLKPIGDLLARLNTPEEVEAFTRFEGFKSFLEQQEIQMGCSAVQDETKLEIRKECLNVLLKNFDDLVHSYLQKQNWVNCEPPTLDPTKWPLPDCVDTYQGYYELSEFQSVQQLIDFISLISYFLQKCAKT